MDIVYVKSMQGECENCHTKIEGEGYLVLDKEKNTVSKCVCSLCRNILDVTRTKKIKLVVKKTTFFFNTFYEIISAKNLHIAGSGLSFEELQTFLNNPDIEVQIKY